MTYDLLATVNFFSVCRDSSGLCNIWGTKGCSPDRSSCGDCRSGYVNQTCNFCDTFYYATKGEIGIVNATGEGVLCSRKFS